MQTRISAKTPQHRFLRVLEEEYHYSPRVAKAILAEAEECLVGPRMSLATGQMRVLLARREAAAGRSLRHTDQVAVIWTIDAGAEDAEVCAEHGQRRLRQVRLQRLLDEAWAQGGVATLEDVARALQVSVRTIKRDAAELRTRGIYLPTRGSVRGIGRGQTHKAVIVGRWLQGQTYDQLVQSTRHTVDSIGRYINAFARVAWFHRQGYTRAEIAALVQVGLSLVDEYLAVYEHHNHAEYADRLQSCLERICTPVKAAQKGGLPCGT
jgi:transposase